MWPGVIIAVYSLLVAGASLGGGLLPTVLRLTHTRLQMMMSCVAGVMLGVALLHLLPHSIHETGSTDTSVQAALAGLLVMFFLIRVFHLHQHAPLTESDKSSSDGEAHGSHEHDHSHDHMPIHGPDEDVDGCGTHQSGLSWVGLFLGLSLHTLIDGMALAASVAAESQAGTFGLWGMGTFLAVLLHKPLDALSITSVMVSGGATKATVRWVNVLFAVMCPLGAFLCHFQFQQVSSGDMVLGCALGVSAGVFLCIALGDILPEVRFHAHDRLHLSLALILGVAIAFAVGLLEPRHPH